jgi:hypothetical protein
MKQEEMHSMSMANDAKKLSNDMIFRDILPSIET